MLLYGRKFALLLVAIWILTSCASNFGTPGQPTSTASSSSDQVSWIISRSALDHLQSAGMSTSTLEHFFDNTRTYMIGQVPGGWQSISMRSFTSYADLQQAFATNSIPASVQAILYDNEAWSLTPLEEQQNFATYVKEVAALVHSHHELLIAAPATDLAHVLDPNGQGDIYTRFLSLGIIKAAATYADQVEIQAQGSEVSTVKYTQFVQGAVTQARAARAGVRVLAGLSTNPSGQQVTGQQLFAAYQATHSQVSGYWLNIPGQGSACPKCGTPQPQVAIDFLQRLF